MTRAPMQGVGRGVVAGAAAMLVAAAGAASAVELTGNATSLEVGGESLCAYSDQDVRAVGPLGGIPGGPCNPTSGPR